MLRVAALGLVVLLLPASGQAQTTGEQQTGAAASQPAPPAAAQPGSDVARIRRGLEAPSPIRDAVVAPDAADATFRTHVDGRVFDIWSFWGEPDTAVSAGVRPWVGGPWHREFQDMVTPDEFKGFGMLGTGERLQLAATQVAFAAAMSLVKAGVDRMRAAAREREQARAKEEVRAALEAFFREHPEARPAAPARPPPPTVP